MSLNPQLYPPIAPVEGSAPRPFWTVIVPAYKTEYLPQSLRSVMDQHPGPDQMEILIFDDCSPHKLEPIVREICGDRAKYIRNPQNLGTYATENAGLAMSRGIWIHILNDDDWVLPGFYSTFQNSLKDQPPRIGAATCRQSNVDQAGRDLVLQPVFRDTPGILDNWIMKVGVVNPVHPIGVIFRRTSFEHLGGFYLGLNYCADWEFNKRCATFYDWWYEPRLMACYRHHTDSVTHEGRMTGEQIRNIGHCIDISEAYLPADKKLHILQQSREAYATTAIRNAAKLLQQNQLPAAIRQVQAGLEISHEPKILSHLSNLLAQPFAEPLRGLLPAFFKMISIRSTNKGTTDEHG